MYIELAGSHTLKDADSAPEELLALKDTRHTLDKKMRQAEVSIFKVRRLSLSLPLPRSPLSLFPLSLIIVFPHYRVVLPS